MSGALGIPFGTQMGVTNGGNPKASKVYTFTITLTSGIAYQIDLRSLQNVNVIHDVQGIYFDNSANTTALKCNIATGQNITCPPQSQGVAPAYVSPGNPVFTFLGNGTVTITLLNFQTPATFWSTVSSNLPVVGGFVQVYDPTIANILLAAETITPLPLDISVVTTGGTAVTAINPGNRVKGGWIQNPSSATTNLGINELGTASGTTSAGNTTFILPGQTYLLMPNALGVSVISSDSAHDFSGYGSM